MASPIASPAFFNDHSIPNNNTNTATATATATSSKDDGFRQSRPMNLVVARSPLFTVPPGLSPSGLLNSPGFFPPQVLCFLFFLFRSMNFRVWLIIMVLW
jgi:hypothetical protein